MNHFAKMCKSSDAEKTRQVNDYSSSDESTWAVSRIKTFDSRPFATIKVGDTKIRMMIDTGSTCNLSAKQSSNDSPKYHAYKKRITR